MKKVIKKISAIAMVFTLVGTGTTIAKNNTLKAKAGIPPQYCRHDLGTHKCVEYKENSGKGYYIVHYCSYCNICGAPRSHSIYCETIR